MKPIRNLVVVCLILLTIFNSCSKNNDPNNTVAPPVIPPVVTPVSGDSNYLDRIYIIDSTSAGEDTVQAEIFNYDNLKRVTTIVDTVFNPVALFAFKQFEYSDTDSLPFKSTLYVYDGPNRDTVIIYHYFNNVGKLTKDSVIDITQNTSPYYQVRQKLISINYSAGMMYGFTRDSATFINNVPSTNPAVITTDTITLDASGNMIHTIQHSGSNTYVSTNTFDNSPHPFRRLNIFMCWSDNIFQNRYYDPSQPNTNNIIHVAETASGSLNYTHDFDLFNSYYNNDFLKTTAHPESAGSSEYIKYLFVYKSL